MVVQPERKWKRVRRVWRIGTIILAGMLLAVIWSFSSFHFPMQDVPFLARLQWYEDGKFKSLGPMTLIGHRGSAVRGTGASPSSPTSQLIGNSAAGIQAAIDAGIEWIEIDLRLTRDQRLVVFHDASIDSKTTGSGRLADLNWADVSGTQLLVEPPESVSTFEAVMERFHRPGRRWIFDIKEPGIRSVLLPWLTDNVREGFVQPEDVVLFGTADVLDAYRSDGFAIGMIAGWSSYTNRICMLFRPRMIVRQCEELGCEYLVLPVIFAKPPLIRAAKQAGLTVWVYGSDHPADLAFLKLAGADGVIVDHPGEIASLIQEPASDP